MFAKSHIKQLMHVLTNDGWTALTDLENVPHWQNIRYAIDVLHWAGVLESREGKNGDLEYRLKKPMPQLIAGLNVFHN